MSRCKTFLIQLLLLLPVLAMGEVRSMEQARQVANDFMTVRSKARMSSVNLRMVYSGEDVLSRSAMTPSYYVFNNEIGPGFVVISGDDSTLPVLGYSDTYNFDTVNMPSNLRWWFRYMDRQVNAARTAGLPVCSREANVGNDVCKYETALWDQVDPYNQECPMDGSVRSYTGCGPTAIAIAMRFREWPEAGTGTIPSYQVPIYDEDYEETGEYKSFSGRTLGEKYNWAAMPLTDGYKNSSWTSENKSQVARLMADIGAATLADYSSEGTGIWDEDVPPAMSTYFGYSKDFKVEFKEDWNTGQDIYTDSQWYSMVKNELLANGPTIYAGSDPEGYMGHMFVLAGYTDADYFYLNWGWGGIANGYYRLNALAPDDQGSGSNDESYHDWVSVMLNFNNPKDIGIGPDIDLKGTTSLKYSHKTKILTVKVASGVSVQCQSEEGKAVNVKSSAADVYEIVTDGLSQGVYEIVLSIGAKKDSVEVILGE